MNLSPEELLMSREMRVAACRRSLALLLIHHGAKPPGEEARKAVARLQREMLAARRRLHPACEQATAAISAKPARRAATDEDLARIREIAVEVMLRCGFRVHELFLPGRDRAMARARHEIMYRAVNETSLSLPQIGRFLGRDHTTVLHGLRKHAERIGAEARR